MEKKSQEFEDSLEFAHNDISDLKTKLEKEKNDCNSCADKLVQTQQVKEKLEKQLQDMARRLDYQDDQGRRINIRISGIKELPNETWEHTQHTVSRVLKEKLDMAPVLERAHRVGKTKEDGTPRDIITRFKYQTDRDAVFRNRRKMKGTHIFINEDLCPGTVKARKDKMPDYRAAREAKQYAYFNYRTLVVKEWRPPITAHRTQPPSQTTRSSHQNVPPRDEARRMNDRNATTATAAAVTAAAATTAAAGATATAAITGVTATAAAVTGATVTGAAATVADVTGATPQLTTNETDETVKMTLRSSNNS